jgi:signal transduction histidine kinase
MQKEGDVLRIQIKDDGKGFEMNDVQSLVLKSMGGNGLKSMTERANTMVASFNIISKMNEGTTVDLAITV